MKHKSTQFATELKEMIAEHNVFFFSFLFNVAIYMYDETMNNSRRKANRIGSIVSALRRYETGTYCLTARYLWKGLWGEEASRLFARSFNGWEGSKRAKPERTWRSGDAGEATHTAQEPDMNRSRLPRVISQTVAALFLRGFDGNH